MNKKNMLISGLVVFVASQVLDYIIHEVLMISAYEATSQLWRPQDEMMSLMWVIYVVGLLWAFIFVYLFDRVSSGKGISDGIKFGFCIGLFTVTPMAYNTYATMPITYSIALGWFGYGMIKVMLCGGVLAMVHKPLQSDA